MTMRAGIFLFGGVEMDDAGSGPPASTDRRYDNDAVWHATERLVDAGLTAERLGYDSYWLTEHHFQYEGYEVVPNGLMFGVGAVVQSISLFAFSHSTSYWLSLDSSSAQAWVKRHSA